MISTKLLGLPQANFQDSQFSKEFSLFAFFITASRNNVLVCSSNSFDASGVSNGSFEALCTNFFRGSTKIGIYLIGCSKVRLFGLIAA